MHSQVAKAVATVNWGCARTFMTLHYAYTIMRFETPVSTLQDQSVQMNFMILLKVTLHLICILMMD